MATRRTPPRGLATTIPSILGGSQVVQNIRRKTVDFSKAYERGVKKAGLMLQRESQKLVPVETGNLKASAFTRAVGKGWNTQVRVGYTAHYAVYVHENREIWPPGMRLKGLPRGASKRGSPGFRGRYWDPQNRAQPKFLEQPAMALKPILKQIIRDEMNKVVS